jgi:hypothetical protein
MFFMKIKIITLTIIAASFFSSCNKDFLDLKPQQSVFSEDIFTSLSSTRAAVNGLYSLMQSYSYYGRDAMVIPEILSDNATRSVKSGNRYTGMNTMTHTATDLNVSRMWSQIYRVVTNANNIIANEDKVKALITANEQAELSQIIGEAYAVRALAYFDLAKFFSRPLKFFPGGDGSHLCVPLVLKPVTNIDEIVYPARNTVAEVYAQIDSDITSALNRLPANGGVLYNGVENSTLFKIRLNKFSVLALRARIAVFKEDWTTALAAATEVINSGKYSLFGYSTMPQDFVTQNNSESIFEVSNNSNDNAGTDSYAYLSSQLGYGELLGTRQSMNNTTGTITLNTFRGLYEIYSATDIRRRFVALGNRNSLGGESNVPLCTKYVNITTYFENIKVLRFAEMYLTRGEALARLAVLNNDATALTNSLVDVNLIRKSRDTATTTRPYSASLATTPPVGTIRATAYVDSIIVERRKELALEGQRLFDLNRTRTNYVKINTAGNGSSRLIQYPVPPATTGSSYYYRTILPIPVSQVQNNPNMVQNPGF